MTDSNSGPMDLTRPDPDDAADAAAIVAAAGCLARTEIRNAHGEDCGGSLICVLEHDHTAKTPGQTAFEAMVKESVGYIYQGEWDLQTPKERALFEAVARAVLASLHYDATDEVWWRAADGDQPETYG